MIISKDALWKGIIESLAEDFIYFFFANYAHQIDFERGFEFLDTELQKLIPDNPSNQRHADKLIKVWLKDGQEAWFLIHIEVQGYQDRHFHRRMFECFYRIWEKYRHPVTGLAIYTDWERTYHFTTFGESFMGSSFNYQFNTYVLRDHPAVELAKNINPFAAVMEAAWQHLDKPADEQDLRALKLDLIQRLKQRNIPNEKISAIINFIKYIAPFKNSEIQAIFEEDLINITKAVKPMGIEQAILEDVKKQGIEQGIELEKQEFTQKLWALQEFSIEKIAALVELTPERVLAIIVDYLQTEGLTKAEAELKIEIYQATFKTL
jgi:predicted transposase/invertase (TIGR01784 family)